MQLIIKQQRAKKMIRDLQNTVQFLCTARKIANVIKLNVNLPGGSTLAR